MGLCEKNKSVFSVSRSTGSWGVEKREEKKGIRSETLRAQNACSSFETQGVTAKLF